MAKKSSSPIRYAVVGLGSFAQLAVLPAFKHANKNSRLVAFVSDDAVKMNELGKRYGVRQFYSYEQFDSLLQSGQIDAVYIVLPNTLHASFALRALKAGIHVLCEKPLATNEADCRQLIQAARQHKTKLMTAYRLHFEQANLQIIQLLRKGKLGEPRLFSSVFSHQVRSGDIRTKKEVGGGGLWDLGVYCINAARYLFRAEPVEAFAVTANTDPRRFHGVDEIAAAILRFPNDQFAQFSTSQGAADVSQYRIVGTKGDISGEGIYEYSQGAAYTVTIDGKKKNVSVPKRDHVAPEILYFSDCVLKNKEPEPSGTEGLLDVRVIEALYRSARIGRPVALREAQKKRRPDLRQVIKKPANAQQELVHAQSPSR